MSDDASQIRSKHYFKTNHIFPPTFFQEKSLQPSIIDGYRFTIADKTGSSILNITRGGYLNRLLDDFHRDRPKGHRGIPTWNLCWVLHQLKKPPFEPLKDSTLNPLSRWFFFWPSDHVSTQIHAWPNKNIRHQKNCLRVFLYTYFLIKESTSKNLRVWLHSSLLWSRKRGRHYSLALFTQLSLGPLYWKCYS